MSATLQAAPRVLPVDQNGLTDVELGELLGLETPCLRRAAEAGLIPGWCIGGRWRFRGREISTWLDGPISRGEADTLRAALTRDT